MPNRVQKQIIKDALDEEHRLSEWESEFVNDMAELDDDKELSDKQNSVLNRIGTKLNGGS